MPPSIPVIVNPATRGCRQSGWREAVTRALAEIGDPHFIVPATPEGTREAARDCARENARLIVVAGGDGTINQVASGTKGWHGELGLLPFGTANDLVRQLRIPLSLRGAARVIVSGRTRAIDAVRINGRRCITVGGLALVAQSALAATALEVAPAWVRRAGEAVGPASYRIAAAVNILLRPHIRHRMTVEADEGEGATVRRLQGEWHGLFIANQPGLGAGLRLPIEAANDDGRCEVVMLKAGTRWRLHRTLWALASGIAPPDGAIAVVTGRTMRITCEEVTACFGDGERFEPGRVFEVEIEPRGLLVRAPEADASGPRSAVPDPQGKSE